MKINKKRDKCKRKVIILNCKWETFILSKNLIRNIEKLKITIPCSKTSNSEIKRYKLSTLNPNIRERIIPNCHRHKCRRNCYKDQHFREVQQMKTKNRINRTEHINSKKSKQENLSQPELKYDDISSGSFSSYEDIEPLMSSTRTRMKELNEHWEFLPRPPLTDEIKSINSLTTIIDGNNNLRNDYEDPFQCLTNGAFYSPTKRHYENLN